MPFNIIIQARCGSKRFPNKILQKIKNETLIEFMIDRISSKFPKKNIIIATTNSKKDDKLISILKKK
jgi:spore coat polysaccharide biosynthesis protein SpsF (cytidylyltransferase family)